MNQCSCLQLEALQWRDGVFQQEFRIDLLHERILNFAAKLTRDDEVVIEATGYSAAVERLLRPFVKRVVIANPRMVRTHPKQTAFDLAGESIKHWAYG